MYSFTSRAYALNIEAPILLQMNRFLSRNGQMVGHTSQPYQTAEVSCLVGHWSERESIIHFKSIVLAHKVGIHVPYLSS